MGQVFQVYNCTLGPDPTCAVTELCLQPQLAASSTCLRSGEQRQEWGTGITPGMWGQGHGQQGDNAPSKTQSDPGELPTAQPMWGWSPANPAPHRGWGHLQLPARSCVITFAKLRRAQPLTPSPSPGSDGCPSFGTEFFGSELKKGKAQLSAVTQIA